MGSFHWTHRGVILPEAQVNYCQNSHKLAGSFGPILAISGHRAALGDPLFQRGPGPADQAADPYRRRDPAGIGQAVN